MSNCRDCQHYRRYSGGGEVEVSVPRCAMARKAKDMLGIALVPSWTTTCQHFYTPAKKGIRPREVIT